MEKRIKLPYDVLYESDVKGSYLLLKLDQEEEIHNYQVEMMMNNDIPSLLDFNLRQKDTHKYLYYNITSKLQLKNLLERRRLRKGELLEILTEISQGILAGGNYLLNHEGYIIDEDYIFLHPETLQVSLLYVPCPIKNRNLGQEMRQLVNRLIISVDPDEESSDNFLLKILYELNMETFNLEGFLSFLREMKGLELRGGQGSVDRKQEVVPVELKPQVKENQGLKQRPNPLKESKRKEKVFSEKQTLEETASTKEEIKVGYTSKTRLIILFSEILIFIMVALIFLETTILKNPATGKTDGVAMVGVLMLAAVVNVLLFKKVFIKENIVCEKKIIPVESVNPIKQQRVKPKQEKQPIAPLNPDYLETMMLDTNRTRPQLISLQGGMIETISIDQDLFLVGKLKGQVDYVIPRKTVSRIHAEIRLKDGEYHLKDLNSRNGTYLNGQRVNSNIDYILKDQDKISFSDAEYIFSLQENAN